MNEQIRVPKVRVISETGEQLGVLVTRDAIDRARSVGLDLMEVGPTENPPVCKIMDYGKYKYQQQKKEHQARKKQHVNETKELRMRPKTDDHDLEIKTSKAREFLEDGCKVQFTMIFRGREQLHQHIGRETFNDIITKLSDVGKVERETRLEGRRMIMILMPSGPVKKQSPAKPAIKIEPKDSPAAPAGAPVEPVEQQTEPATQEPASAGMENGNETV
jgi:translation initiation factor IF-3